MNKTAGRRVPGRSARELQAAVEHFLKASRKPALLEPGEEIIPLTTHNFSLDTHHSRVTVQAWDERRNIVRRLVEIREQQRGRLELVTERFAGKRGALFLIDLAQSTGHDWERRGTRLVFRERFRQFLSREFPAWTIAELTTEADLEHSLSPAYPRALVRNGATGLAAIGASAESLSASGALSFGLIWLDYLRKREKRIMIEGLVLLLPAGEERTTSLRARFLNQQAARFEIFAYSSNDQTARIDLSDAGNLETKLEVRRQPSSGHRTMLGRLLTIGLSGAG